MAAWGQSLIGKRTVQKSRIMEYVLSSVDKDSQGRFYSNAVVAYYHVSQNVFVVVAPVICDVEPKGH